MDGWMDEWMDILNWIGLDWVGLDWIGLDAEGLLGLLKGLKLT